MKNTVSMVAALAAVLLLATLPLLTGCENPQPSRGQGGGGCTRPKVIAFTATWCGPCKQAKSHLARIEASGVEVQIVDIDQNPEMARKYGVTSVPTFFVYACGKKAVRTQDISAVISLVRFGR